MNPEEARQRLARIRRERTYLDELEEVILDYLMVTGNSEESSDGASLKISDIVGAAIYGLDDDAIFTVNDVLEVIEISSPGQTPPSKQSIGNALTRLAKGGEIETTYKGEGRAPSRYRKISTDVMNGLGKMP